MQLPFPYAQGNALQSIAMCLSLKILLMFPIAVDRSSFPQAVFSALSASRLLYFQPGSCDSRHCRVAGQLPSSWSQHHLPTASRVWFHYQQARWKVETIKTQKDGTCFNPFMLHSYSVSLSFNSLVLTWWPWARCPWHYCFSARPSCHRHAPSGLLTTTSWSWIKCLCPGRKFNLLNVTSGVFWVPIHWCCPTLFPDTRQHVQRRGQQCRSYRCKRPLHFSILLLSTTWSNNET